MYIRCNCIRGYHIYEGIWNPLVAETVNCDCEKEIGLAMIYAAEEEYHSVV